MVFPADRETGLPIERDERNNVVLDIFAPQNRRHLPRTERRNKLPAFRPIEQTNVLVRHYSDSFYHPSQDERANC